MRVRSAISWGIALTCLVGGTAEAKEDPVQWTLTPKTPKVSPGGHLWLEFKADIEPGWHLYSPTTPPGGPIITKIALSSSPAVSSYQLYRPEPVRKLDPNFNIDTETYTQAARFLFEAQTASTAAGSAPVEATVRY